MAWCLINLAQGQHYLLPFSVPVFNVEEGFYPFGMITDYYSRLHSDAQRKSQFSVCVYAFESGYSLVTNILQFFNVIF
jgi:hypothetical protein